MPAMASAFLAFAAALGAPGPAPLRLRLGALGARGNDETWVVTTGTRLELAEEQGADPRGIGRLLLWSAITGPGKPGGEGKLESRDVHTGACFTAQKEGRTAHSVLCEHKMLGLSVFSCGVQASDARAICGADKATQGACGWQHGGNNNVERNGSNGGLRREQMWLRNLSVFCCGGSSCGAACMLPPGVAKTTEGGGEQWHAVWEGAASVRTTDGSGRRRYEPWMAGAEQQQLPLDVDMVGETFPRQGASKIGCLQQGLKHFFLLRAAPPSCEEPLVMAQLWNGEGFLLEDWEEDIEIVIAPELSDYSSWHAPRDPGRRFRPPSLTSLVKELWEEHGKPGLPKATEAAEKSQEGRLVLVKPGKSLPNP
jgi:hypothetical protein